MQNSLQPNSQSIIAARLKANHLPSFASPFSEKPLAKPTSLKQNDRGVGTFVQSAVTCGGIQFQPGDLS